MNQRVESVRRRRLLQAGGAAAISAALPLRYAHSQGQKLRIGVLMPRSGIQAQFGQDSVRGIEVALDVLPGRGYPVPDLVHADYETKVDLARAQAERLIDQGCHLILGCYDSGATVASAQVCEQKGIPLVVNVAAAPAITDGRFKTVFRNFPTGPMIAGDAFLLQKELFQMAGRVPKTAVMLHANDTFGTTQRDATVKLIDKFDMPYKLLDTIAYDPAARDLSAEVRKAKSSGAEMVWIITRLNDAILMIREMVKQRWLPMGILNSGPGPYDDPFLKQLGKLSDDIISTVPWFDPSKALAKAMMTAWEKRYPDRNLNTSHSHSFEATLIALDAFKRAGSTEPGRLIEALRATDIKDNVTVGPGIKFDQNGQNPETRNSGIQNRAGKLIRLCRRRPRAARRSGRCGLGTSGSRPRDSSSAAGAQMNTGACGPGHLRRSARIRGQCFGLHLMRGREARSKRESG